MLDETGAWAASVAALAPNIIAMLVRIVKILLTTLCSYLRCATTGGYGPKIDPKLKCR